MKKDVVKQPGERVHRMNIQLVTDKEQELYRRLKMRAAERGIYLKELVLEWLEERLNRK